MNTPPSDELRAAIRERALALGFDAIGFAAPDEAPGARARLAEFLAAGWYGDMGWLAAHEDRRGAPSSLWPEARSVVVLAASYRPGVDPMQAVGQPERGAISVYARTGKDYHDALKKRL